jgi:RNA polymerase sigma-70 factor (ECF subfamily)
LEGLEKDEDLKTIQKALTKIRPLYSEVIIFYYFDNLPLKEIALILNKKENNIRVLLHRAMKALKEEVEKEEHLS